MLEKLKKVERKFRFISAENMQSEVVSNVGFPSPKICRSSSTYHPWLASRAQGGSAKRRETALLDETLTPMPN